jgi:hypothetical protein
MDHFIATQLQTVTEKMTAMILQQGEEFLSYQASVMTDLVQRVDAKKVMLWPVSVLRSKQKLPQVQALAEAHSQWQASPALKVQVISNMPRHQPMELPISFKRSWSYSLKMMMKKELSSGPTTLTSMTLAKTGQTHKMKEPRAKMTQKSRSLSNSSTRTSEQEMRVELSLLQKEGVIIEMRYRTRNRNWNDWKRLFQNR